MNYAIISLMVYTEGACGIGTRSAWAPKICPSATFGYINLKIKGVRKSSSDTIITPCFMKICRLVQELKWRYIRTCTHTMVTSAYFVFHQNANLRK